VLDGTPEVKLPLLIERRAVVPVGEDLAMRDRSSEHLKTDQHRLDARR
jgi:hypothetical protein